MPITETSNAQEIWKSPPSLKKPWVEVSNLGRVRIKPHKISYSDHFGHNIERFVSGGIRTLSMDSRGRKQFQTQEKNIHKGYLVHRLVAECFVENTNPKTNKCVLFKNGNIADCRASNLQWANYQYRNYLLRGKRIKNLISLFSNRVRVGTFNGLGETARFLGCTKQAVAAAIRRKGTCKGFEITTSFKSMSATQP